MIIRDLRNIAMDNMPTSASLPTSDRTNDELKKAILGHYSAFVSDVDPVMLSDHLIENHVISVEEWDRMKTREVTRHDICRALLNRLCLQNNPMAFLIVRKALEKANHWLLPEIDRPTQGLSQMRRSSRNLRSDLEKTEEIIVTLLREIDRLNQENNLLKTLLQQSPASVSRPKEAPKCHSATVEPKISKNQKVKPTETPSTKPQSPKCQSNSSPLQPKKKTPLETNSNSNKKSDEKIVTNSHQKVKAFCEKFENLSKGQNGKTLLKPRVEAVDGKTVKTEASETSEPLKNLRTQNEEENSRGVGLQPTEVKAKTRAAAALAPSSPMIRATIEQVTMSIEADPIILKQLAKDEETSTEKSHKNIIEAAQVSSQNQPNDIETTLNQPIVEPDLEQHNGGLIDPTPNGRRKQSIFHDKSAIHTILPPKKKKTKLPSASELFQQNT